MTWTKKYAIVVYYLILIAWGSLSLIRTFNNIIKFFREDARLLIQNDKSNRREVYGELIDFCGAINSHTFKLGKILFLSSGGKPYYFCSYQVYPRQLYIVKTPHEAQIKSKTGLYDYLLIYKSINPLENDYKSEHWDLEQFKGITIYKSKIAEGRLIKL